MNSGRREKISHSGVVMSRYLGGFPVDTFTERPSVEKSNGCKVELGMLLHVLDYGPNL